MPASIAAHVGPPPYESESEGRPETTYLLIVDGHPGPTLRLSQKLLSENDCRVEAVCTAAAALQRISSERPAAIVIGSPLPDRDALDLQAEVRRRDPNVPVIFVASAMTADLAIRAMKQGAHDCLSKPVDEQVFQRVIEEALRLSEGRAAAAAAPEAAPSPGPDDHGIVAGDGEAMRTVYKSIGLVAAQDVNVLVTGESGTGKELVARAIHRHSARADAPFLALNCAAIPENLLESELFGHEKGAFSGADRCRIGKFEQCDGGTLLLDEIGDMPLALQAKILRVIQEQSFERVGGNQTIRTNVRLIASTHRDLKRRSAEEKFRADLFYRLSIFTIHLPPLRERGEDLPMLVRHFLNRYGRELGREINSVAPEALDRLRRYPWPGNVRELQNVMKQALLRARGHVLLAEFLPPLSAPCPAPPASPAAAPGAFDIRAFLRERLGPDAREVYAELHREVDRHSLAQVLTFTGGNQHVASRVLGIARQTLRRKLRESGLRITQSVGGEADHVSTSVA